MQLPESRRSLVRPFAVPVPTREVVMLTAPDFVRRTLLERIIDIIRNSLPHEMLRLNVSQKSV
jgi:hypothetical protein